MILRVDLHANDSRSEVTQGHQDSCSRGHLFCVELLPPSNSSHNALLCPHFQMLEIDTIKMSDGLALRCQAVGWKSTPGESLAGTSGEHYPAEGSP